MIRIARARFRAALFAAAVLIAASAGAVVAARMLTAEPVRMSPAATLRDLGAPAAMAPADDADAAGPGCKTTPGICAGPSALRAIP